MLKVYVDADACAVKDETYLVARKHQVQVAVVANQWIRMPDDPTIRLEVVDDGFDAADNWIVEQVKPLDIVITDDIPLAARCIAKKALVVTCRGTYRDANTIGEAVASRQFMQYLRAAGEVHGGSKPMHTTDRKHFTRQLERLILGIKQSGLSGP